MTISIGQQDPYGFRVFQDEKEIGHVKRFCCGVDFVPIGGLGPGKHLIFSILNLKRVDDPRVTDCIEEIIQLDLDHLNGHFNYKHSSQRERDFEEIKKHFEKIAGGK